MLRSLCDRRLLLVVIWCCLASRGPARAQDLPLQGVLIDSEDWQVVSEGYKFTEGPAANPQGEVFFTDVPESKIYKIGLEGQVSLFAKDTQNTNGLMFGPDGKLYGCRNGAKEIVAYRADGTFERIVGDVNSNDLVVNGRGEIYFTDPQGGRIWFVDSQRQKRVVAEGLKPNGIILWPDQGTLVVTDSSEPVLWTFRVEQDGSLTYKERYYGPLRMAPGADRTGADGMTIDTVGRLYVTSRVGLQMFDPTGRLGGVIAKPQAKSLSNVAFGGPQLDTLYATSTDKVYRRKTQARGVVYAALPPARP